MANIKIGGAKYNNVTRIKALGDDGEFKTYVNANDTTATPADVALGKTFYGQNGFEIGEMEVLEPGEVRVEEDDAIVFLDGYGIPFATKKLSDLPLSSLPELPQVEGYNIVWEDGLLDKVNAVTDSDIFAPDVYNTDGFTKIYIHGTAPGSAPLTNFNFYLAPMYSDETANITVDWGDGQTTDSGGFSGSKYFTHTYATPNDYVIKIKSNNDIKYLLGANTTTQTSTNNFIPYDYRMYVYKFETGTNCAGFSYNAWYFNSSYLYGPYRYSSIEKILLSNDILYLGTRPFDNGFKIKGLILPKSIKQTHTTAFTIYIYNKIYCYIKDNQSTGYIAMQCESDFVWSNRPIAKIENINTFDKICSCVYFRKIYVGSTLGDYLKVSAGRGLATNSTSSASMESKIFMTENGIMKEQKDIIIPDDITALPTYAFAGWGSIRSIKLNGKIENIPTAVLYYNKNIESIDFDGIKTISTSNHIAQYNSKLKKIVIPASLQTLNLSLWGIYQSNNVAQVEIVQFKGDTPPQLSSSTYTYYPWVKIYVPNLEVYKKATNYSYMAPSMVEGVPANDD